MKKIITRALLIIFSVGMLIMILSNLFFQMKHQKDDYKRATEGGFLRLRILRLLFMNILFRMFCKWYIVKRVPCS